MKQSELLKQLGETTCKFRQINAYTTRQTSTDLKSSTGAVDLAACCADFINPRLDLPAKDWARNYTLLFPHDYPPATEHSDDRAPGRLCAALSKMSKRLSACDRCTSPLKAASS